MFNIHENTFFKLFDGYNFPKLEVLTIEFLQMKRLTKEFINRLTKPKKLNLFECGIVVIERDSLSNMQQLTSLDLSQNQIAFIEKNSFSSLANLQTLIFKSNILRKVHRRFTGLGKSVKLKIK